MKIPLSVICYVAGFFDGEGCVTFKNYTPGSKYNGCTIQFTNTNKNVLEYIQKYIGGTIYSVDHKKGRNVLWKDMHTLKLNSYELQLNFLKLVEPHLVIKKEAASLMIEYISSRKDDYYRPPTSRQLEIKSRIKQLNKKGV